MQASEQDSCSDLPPELQKISNNVKENILPDKSACRYKAAYNAFLDWKTKNNLTVTSEDCLLVYFQQIIMAKYSPNSCWSYYSMIKSLIRVKKDIDISKYHSLSYTLKKITKIINQKRLILSAVIRSDFS